MQISFPPVSVCVSVCEQVSVCVFAQKLKTVDQKLMQLGSNICNAKPWKWHSTVYICIM